jgi:hypothetical protein
LRPFPQRIRTWSPACQSGALTTGQNLARQFQLLIAVSVREEGVVFESDSLLEK